MDIVQNTLYVTTEGAYLHRDHLTLKVEVEKELKLAVPIHHLQSVVLMGHVMMSPSAMELCASEGVAVSFLSPTGRLLARVDAPGSGNVLLRREQHRWADRMEKVLDVGRQFVAGKLNNGRSLLLRAAREADTDEDSRTLEKAGASMLGSLEALERAKTPDEIRGIEGEAAAAYFGVFPILLKPAQRQAFPMSGRNRRPPLDSVNALLSFTYALLLHDCVAALASTGLDPSVGFLHTDRPGRPSLALDLMEEFRPLIADRLVAAVINRKQAQPRDFVKREGGAVEMKDGFRKDLISAYQERKQEEVTHALLKQNTRVGMLPFLQARILARHIRGDIPAYVPCLLR